MLRPNLTAVFAATSLAFAAAAQDPDLKTKDNIKGGPPAASPPRLQQGLTEEQMWRPPTKADWKKPVLIKFERTWGDAVAVAKETNKPILVCVNMDGEIASEHYAGVHYRTPETAKTFEDYVCVIASVYRHTPHDHDAQGNRIPCPRFGCVTCGEHIAIEPLMFKKFMNGQRISPRHIMVELDGTEKFDVFFAWDNKSIFDTIKKGITDREAQPRTIVRGDRPILERVASRAREDRESVEQAYQNGDRALREQLLKQAIAHPGAAPVGLLRLAIFDVDEGLARLARQALAKVNSPSAVDLITEALRVPLPEDERKALITALERLREHSPWAKVLANVHKGLSSSSKAVDIQGWRKSMAGGQTYQAADAVSVERRAAAREKAAASRPKDAEALLDLAESSLELALDPATAERYWGAGKKSKFGKLLLADAERQADAARQAGAKSWRVDAIRALCEYYTGSRRRSYTLAIRAAADMPPKPDKLLAVSTMALFAEARIDAIWKAIRAKKDWPGEWMTDVSSAFAVLATHPLGTDAHVLRHYDFLKTFRANRRANRVLDQGLQRFPHSPTLHHRLRKRILAEEGVEALARRYTALREARPDDAAMIWFAGYAAVVEAEYLRRNTKPEAAVAAYDRAIALFATAKERDPASQRNSDYYTAQALSAKARLAVEKGELEKALDLCLQGIALHPEATPHVDGMQLSPAQTALLIESRLKAAKDAAALARLQKVLSSLDPALLRMPDYEPEDQRQRATRGRGQGR